MTVNYFQ